MAAGLARIRPGGSRFGLGKLWWQQVSPRPSLVAAGQGKIRPGGSRFGYEQPYLLAYCLLCYSLLPFLLVLVLSVHPVALFIGLLSYLLVLVSKLMCSDMI